MFHAREIASVNIPLYIIGLLLLSTTQLPVSYNSIAMAFAYTLTVGLGIIRLVQLRYPIRTYNRKIYRTALVGYIIVSIIFMYYKLTHGPFYSGEKAFHYLVYASPFIFVMYIQRLNMVTNQRMKVILRIYLYTYYLSYNIMYIAQHGGVPHNALVACLGLLLLSDALNKLIYEKKTARQTIWVSIEVVFLVIMPILAILRGATITMGMILVIQAMYVAKATVMRVILFVAVIVSILLIITSSQYVSIFASKDLYGYTKPSDILSSITEEDSNRDIRIEWLDEAATVIKKAPLFGTMLQFTFHPFGKEEDSSMLHNYYAGLIVDTGIITLLCYILIVTRAMINGHRSIAAGNVRNVTYICWLVAIMSTLYTNCYGHIWNAGLPMFVLQAYAIHQLTRHRRIRDS